MVNRPTAPFAAIVEGQAPWWRIGTSGVLVLAAYLGLLLAALGLGGAAAPRPPPWVATRLVVTLLDRPPSAPAAGPSTPAPARAAGVPDRPAERATAAPQKAHARASKPASKTPDPAASAPQPTAAASAAPSARPALATTAATAAASGTTAAGSETTRAATASGDAPPSGETVLPFIDGMQRPELIEIVPPEYTREAREANVQGLFLAKCVITIQGRLQNCRVVKGLPMMDRAVLSALARWRYTPVIYRGKAVAVDYVVQVRLAGP